MMGAGILWIFFIIIAVAYVMGWRPDLVGRSGSSTAKSAREILKERYARGEISQEQFQEMRKDLED